MGVYKYAIRMPSVLSPVFVIIVIALVLYSKSALGASYCTCFPLPCRCLTGQFLSKVCTCVAVGLK